MKRNEIILSFISILIIVFVWMGFNIYRSAFQSTISDDLNQQIIPIKPEFNSQIIEHIQSRKKAVPIFNMQADTVPGSPTPTVSILQPTAGATTSANIQSP